MNGDIYTWKSLWPDLGAYFGLKVEVYDEPLDMEDFTKGKDKVWDEIVEKHGLQVCSLPTDIYCPFISIRPEFMFFLNIQLNKNWVYEYGNLLYKHKTYFQKFKLLELAKTIPLMGTFMSVNTSMLSDMTKSREFGFKSYIATKNSFYKAFDYLRKNKYIP